MGFDFNNLTSNSFRSLIASQQGFIGETNSSNFKTQVGWIFSIFSDGTPPTIIAVYPSVDFTTNESNPTFIVVAEDLHSGLDYCNVKVYRNGSLISDSNVSPDNGYYGECRITVSLEEDFDYATADWEVFDNVGNSSAASSAQFIKSSVSGVTVVRGDGFGGEGTQCVSSLQCLNNIFCFSGFCAYQTVHILRDLNELVVIPTYFNLMNSNIDSSAGKTFSLKVSIRNKGNRVLPIKAFFDCRTDFFCAKDWCELREENNFVLNPTAIKRVDFDCSVPQNVSIGDVFESNLIFRTPSFAEKIVKITIPIKKPAGTFEVVPETFVPFSAFPFSLPVINIGSIYFSVKEIFDYGLVCFGERPNCLVVLGVLEILGFSVAYLSLSTILLIIIIGVNVRYKGKNIVLLGLLGLFILLKVVFWLF